jgi:hypothetical protein
MDYWYLDSSFRVPLTGVTIGYYPRYVLRQCLDRCVPVATVIGGGYDDTHSKLAQRHAVIIRTAVATWQNYVCRMGAT